MQPHSPLSFALYVFVPQSGQVLLTIIRPPSQAANREQTLILVIIIYLYHNVNHYLLRLKILRFRRRLRHKKAKAAPGRSPEQLLRFYTDCPPGAARRAICCRPTFSLFALGPARPPAPWIRPELTGSSSERCSWPAASFQAADQAAHPSITAC